MIPTDVPPPVNQPVQVMKVKDIQLEGLISKLSYSLSFYRKATIDYGKDSMIKRALLLDLLKTKNREYLFQFNFIKNFIPAPNTFCSRAVEELQIQVKGCSIDDVINALDISFYSDVLDNLYGDLKMKSVGGKNVDLSPSWDKDDRYNRLPKCMHYLIAALRLQNFQEPEFTKSTYVPQGIPIRLETGEPNYQFFNQWYDNCVNYLEGK